MAESIRKADGLHKRDTRWWNTKFAPVPIDAIKSCYNSMHLSQEAFLNANPNYKETMPATWLWDAVNFM